MDTRYFAQRSAMRRRCCCNKFTRCDCKRDRIAWPYVHPRPMPRVPRIVCGASPATHVEELKEAA